MRNDPVCKLFARHFLAITLLASLVTFANPARSANACLEIGSGIGGTGHSSEESGIGGTGAPAPHDESAGDAAEPARASGVGGTGIVGTITGFASICVNGIEVHFGAGTPVDINGQSAKAADLAVGQIVAIEASGTGDEVKARRIAVVHAVTGPVSRIDVARGEAEILGQKIQLTDTTIVSNRAHTTGRLDALQPGDFVQVSGLRRRDGTIVSSRIEQSDPRAQVSVSGPVTALENNAFRIHGLRVVTTAVRAPAELALGRVVRVSGAANGGRLRAERLHVEPSIPFGGRVERLELQGYIRERHADHTLIIDQMRVEVSPQTRIREGDADALMSDRRVRISARVTPDRRLLADRIEIDRGEHRFDDTRGRSNHGGANRGRDGDGERTREDRSGRSDRPERIDRSGSNSGSHRDRVERDRLERGDRVRVERPERLDRSGRH